jgi:subtilisin family serine protease
VLSENTTHSEFEAMLREILKESPDSDVHEQVEGKFAKIIATNISEEIAHKLKHSNKVEFIEEECYATSSVSWALDRIDQESSQLDNVFSPKGTGEGVDIYILDTGINYDHNEFGGRAKYPGFDPVDKGDGENRRGRDCDGHGTHVASLAAGTDFGVAKKADVYSVRVLDCQGSAPWSFIIDGLNSVAERIGTQKRPAVISMSLGGSFSNSLNVALKNVLKKNLTVVAAAGNERNDACNTSPGGTTGVITVGGTAINDNTYYYTNGGNCVDILAPGNNVEAADYKCNSCKITFSGTSMATPIVSGAVALYLQTNPNMTPTQIRNKLIADSVKNKINYQNLRSSLRQTTANRLLQIQGK